MSRVNGAVLWANLHLLFWLSLIPFTTAWMSENSFPPAPVGAYGVVLLAAGVAYFVVQTTLLRVEGRTSMLALAVGTRRQGQDLPAALLPGHRPVVREPVARPRACTWPSR